MAGWFWIGAGLSSDTGGSLPSSSVLWCLGGPRGDGNLPQSRTESLSWHPPTPSPWRACRIPRRTRQWGDLCRLGRRTLRRPPSPREKTGTTKNFSKNKGKINEGKKVQRLLCFWVQSSVTSHVGARKTRRRGASANNLKIY